LSLTIKLCFFRSEQFRKKNCSCACSR